VTPEVEMKITVQALRLNTHSKLTFADSNRFDSLIKDVFPNVSFQDVEHHDLDKALREACAEANLIVIESQVRMSMQISINGTGKSVNVANNNYIYSYTYLHIIDLKMRNQEI